MIKFLLVIVVVFSFSCVKRYGVVVEKQYSPGKEWKEIYYYPMGDDLKTYKVTKSFFNTSSYLFFVLEENRKVNKICVDEEKYNNTVVGDRFEIGRKLKKNKEGVRICEKY